MAKIENAEEICLKSDDDSPEAAKKLGEATTFTSKVMHYYYIYEIFGYYFVEGSIFFLCN